MKYEAPAIFTITISEVESASINAFMDSCGGWFQPSSCQCQCQCQCQHQ